MHHKFHSGLQRLSSCVPTSLLPYALSSTSASAETRAPCFYGRMVWNQCSQDFASIMSCISGKWGRKKGNMFFGHGTLLHNPGSEPTNKHTFQAFQAFPAFPLPGGMSWLPGLLSDDLLSFLHPLCKLFFLKKQKGQAWLHPMGSHTFWSFDVLVQVMQLAQVAQKTMSRGIVAVAINVVFFTWHNAICQPWCQ